MFSRDEFHWKRLLTVSGEDCGLDADKLAAQREKSLYLVFFDSKMQSDTSEGKNKPDQSRKVSMKLNYLMLLSVCLCSTLFTKASGQSLQPSGGLNGKGKYPVQQRQDNASQGASAAPDAQRLRQLGGSYSFISGLTDPTEKDAAIAACAYLAKERYYRFSEDSVMIWDPNRPREYRKLSVVVTTTLTEADKLNGENWRGLVTLKAEAMRFSVDAPGSFDSFFNQTPNWTKWYPVEDGIVTLRMYMKDGRLFVGR